MKSISQPPPSPQSPPKCRCYTEERAAILQCEDLLTRDEADKLAVSGVVCEGCYVEWML